nr:hypothetical protein [Tanacetum cinerariifolium]
MKYYEPNPCYDSNHSGFDNFQPSQSVIDHLNLQQRVNDLTIELRGTFQAWFKQRKDQVVNLDSYFPNPLQCQKIPNCYDDDDDEKSSTPLSDPCIAITPEAKDSLIMGDEHLDTIPEKELDEFIKFSVENLVPNPSESKDERECDVFVCDDFTIFSNLLFDADDDFSSSDNESFFNKDIPKEIYSNPLFDEEIISIKIDPRHFNVGSDLIESLLNQDSLIITSSKIDSLLHEFIGELIFFKSIPPGIDEADHDPNEEIRLIEKLLYDNSSPRPPKEFISENFDAIIESFSPSLIPVEGSDFLMEEIDLSLTPDDSMPPGIENDDYESERNILFLKELLGNDSLSLPENKSFHFDIPSSPRLPAKPPDDGIYFNDEPRDNLFPERLLHDDPIPFSDILDFSNVVWIFPPLFTYSVTSSILLSSESEDIIFDPGISDYHFSSLESDVFHRSGTFIKFNLYPNHLNESPMEILSSTCSPWTNEFRVESGSRLG